MATFTGSDELQGSTFTRLSLRDARFVEVDLTGVVMRAVDLAGADLDAPWLLDGGSSLLINGVDVAPLVEGELNRRFPGRAERRAASPQGLRDAWAKVEQTWAATVARVATLPAGTVDVSVGGEWSFAQTLRHLVMATDTWLRGAVLSIDRPYHTIGQPNVEYALDGHDPTVFSGGTPPFSEVLEVRAERVAMVRDYLASVTDAALDETRPNPWAPARRETVRSCLHTILEEEWEHHRFAVRDLETLVPAGTG